MENDLYSNLSPEEFKLKAKEENTVILDVRTAAECAAGIIDGAITELDMYNGEFEEKFKQDKALIQQMQEALISLEIDKIESAITKAETFLGTKTNKHEK